MSESFGLSDAEYERLTHRVQELIERTEQLPYPKIRDLIFELLRGLDALHREALARMLRRVEEEAPELAERLPEDRVVRTLLALYNFGPGADEIPEPSEEPDGFVAKDQVGIMDGDTSDTADNEITRPVWIPGGQRAELDSGALSPKSFEGQSVLLCRVDDEMYALENVCPGSALTLQQGHLEGHTLVCPWHGCRYDVRTGERQDEPEAPAVQTFPVRIGDDGQFSVGFNVRHGAPN